MVQILSASFLALATGIAAVHGAAAAAALTCTPKIRGTFRFGGAAPGYVDVLLKVQAIGDKVIDSQGQNATLMVSSDTQFAESWDFVQCDSKYMGYKSTDTTFYGQLRPSPTGKAKIGKHCLTTQQPNLKLSSNGAILTNFTSSLGCDVDDKTQVQRFFSAQYDTYENYWSVNFLGNTQKGTYQDPDIDSFSYFQRETDKAPFRLDFVDLGQDRKAGKRQGYGEDNIGGVSVAQDIALLGRAL